MRASIVYPMDHCCLCGSVENLHSHEIFFGSANRQKSIEDGMIAPLCVWCHEGSNGVHHNRYADLILKHKGQEVWEKVYGKEDPREEFIDRYGKSWADEGAVNENTEVYDISKDKLPF